MAEEKDKKAIDVCFPDLDCSAEDKKVVRTILDNYINEKQVQRKM